MRSVARVVDLLDPEIEYVNPPEAIERGARRGIEGMTEVVRSMRESQGPYRLEVERMLERGERVALLCRLHGAGPGSGVRVAGPPRLRPAARSARALMRLVRAAARGKAPGRRLSA